jgi:thiol-disulfide isomerase/thioredoxin
MVICLGFLSGNATAADTDPDGAIYRPSADALADVQQAMDRARDSGRRVLVVLGANWCHDSRALAKRLNRSPLTEVVQEHYELVLVDVGFYENGRKVVQQFGVPHYYATPTVLIVEPSTGLLVDKEERHRWGNAYRISMSDSVEYFEKWAADRPAPAPDADSAELKELYAEIDEFERQAAERVAAGYAVVGPMLAAYKAGNAPADFDASWEELSAFRNSIPGDVRMLREEARRRVAAGESDIELTYPECSPLSWESED